MAVGKRRGNTEVEHTPRIRIAQTTYQKAILRKLITQILLVVLAIVVVYVVFAGTLLRIVPSTSNGFTLIKNNTFSGERVPAGEDVMISTTTDQGSGFLDHLAQSFTPQSNTAIVQVLAGPSGTVKWSKDGVLKVDGKALPVSFPVDPNKPYLNYEYIAICIKGDCNPGEPLIFGQDRIYGVPLKKSELKNGVDLSNLKGRVEGTEGRPTVANIAVWVKGTHQNFNNAQASCIAGLFYNSSMTSEELTKFVNGMVAGTPVTPTADEQNFIDGLYTSTEGKACVSTNKGAK